MGGLPRPFALQLPNPPPNRVDGLRRLELRLTGLTLSGACVRDALSSCLRRRPRRVGLGGRAVEV